MLLVYVPHEETAESVVLARVLDQVGKPDLVVLGEPTDLRLGIGHRGRVMVRLEARGRAAHAAMPELGENAIERMMEALPYALAATLPEDPVLGWGSATPVDRRIGRGETEATVLAAYDGLRVEARIERAELTAYTGERFTTQLFFPARWMDPAHPWVGRADEKLAHQPAEHVHTADLAKAADGYRRLLRAVMAGGAQPRPAPEGRRNDRRGWHRRRRD